jgi:pimeloyl-ACP methyl ester carboxylesterase
VNDAPADASKRAHAAQPSTADHDQGGPDVLRDVQNHLPGLANGPEVVTAQYDAIVEWGIPDPSKLARLRGISQATLVANGDNDMMTPTANSHILGHQLPNARVRIYPDAGHGFLFQWPREFAALVNEFLA